MEQILSANQIDAEILSIYDVRGARTENWKYLNNYDAILFASASGVHAFADCLAETGQPDWNPAQGKKRIVLGTIGQVTADALIKCEARWHLMSDRFIVANLVPLRAEPSESVSA